MSVFHLMWQSYVRLSRIFSMFCFQEYWDGLFVFSLTWQWPQCLSLKSFDRGLCVTPIFCFHSICTVCSSFKWLESGLSVCRTFRLSQRDRQFTVMSIERQTGSPVSTQYIDKNRLSIYSWSSNSEKWADTHTVNYQVSEKINRLSRYPRNGDSEI